MREIKFRYWNKQTKGMLKVFQIQSSDFLDDNLNLIDGGWRYPEDVILMQYTGLKDCKGKEIYEGDILKDDKEIMSVEWYCGGFSLVHYVDYPDTTPTRWLEEISEYSPNEKCVEPIEIIGNIYENPELLNSQT